MMRPLTQLIFVSRPLGFEAATLRAILDAAHRRNRAAGLTGALVCRADIYLQMLEGSRATVTACFGRILADRRHSDVELVWVGDALRRLFPQSSLRDDPPHAWMWGPAEIRQGAARQAGAAAYRQLFDRLAESPRLRQPWEG
ncbi:BLUF domain-containing protein [Siccirubricoccus sp. KC 17139]|uniref:BLUF domain-containing protein n=1 Tax=Siccirubricoccus soli TaxID=2899147 RepID=A0ABT1D0M2_9PROT|nr:BLUF domain-containing protein [Siccirubricoccus soli]MCO6415463.1 BLUF domain-containing protein [Siccirubricoccus soli]MCP2681595.1 BLUF domain-containing protein [Siccirubricoccus soli]